ncbi:hypothetical protein [Methanobrevibacter sp.]|uniref:hypothetical protein n=1 Tax=Methanobrevibacter sp. TaxID=66852 RepID=UPI0025FFA02E|nr:hypothetical protein [Methanobrevibacter sp.]MBR4447200.1 hypothetical protein [Methanobrevibacter sp.]
MNEINQDEFEKRVIELYLNEYPADKREIILERLNRLVKRDRDFMNRSYEHTCINYRRGYNPDFEALALNTMQFYIGGNFDDKSTISDLKKIEENFHILINDFYLSQDCIGDYDYRFPKITEDLFVREDFNRVPGMYGGFFYFLNLESGKPILYANASSRMDLDELIIIDEICYTWVDDDYGKMLSGSKIEQYWR